MSEGKIGDQGKPAGARQASVESQGVGLLPQSPQYHRTERPFFCHRADSRGSSISLSPAPCGGTWVLYELFFFFFFNNSFIEIHFKCYTVYPLKVCHLVVIYKVYHSQTGANITTLYFGNIFIIPKRTPVLLSGHCPQPQAATSLISVSMELPVLDISCEYNM